MKNKKNYEIKNDRGLVIYVMRTGKVFVKSDMPLSTANRIVKNGKDVKVSDKRGYGKEICVDDTYFFPIDETKVDVEENTDEVAE